MNIGFDASRAFTDNRTGTENYSFQILKHLIQLDHTNKYWIYLRPGLEDGKSKIEGSNLKVEDRKIDKTINHPSSTFKDPPSTFHHLSSNKLITIPFPRLWTQAGLAQQTFKDKLDVLFIPAHTIPLVRRPGLKTIVTVHDLGAEYLPKTHQIKQRLYLNLMTRHQLKSATHIIAVSEATKNDLVKKVGIPKEKISVVYEGYDKDKFKIQNSKFKINQNIKQYNLTYHNYFLFVGTIQPRKNIVRLITAYAHFLRSDDGRWKIEDSTSKIENRRLKNPFSTLYHQKSIFHPLPSTVKLVLVGSKGWLSDEIYELPKKLGIKDQVKFLGYVPDEKLPALYSGAKALLFPSLFEGFGLPILEAMAVGCPVLTSNTSSMPEITRISRGATPEERSRASTASPELVEGRGRTRETGGGRTPSEQHAAILVNPYSVEDIAQGIERIMNDELRVKLVKAGFEQIKKFSWEKAAQQTLQVLEKVWQRRPKPL